MNSIARAGIACVAWLVGAASAEAQRVVITDVGPGATGPLLQAALAKPHHLVTPDTSWYVIPRGVEERTTLIVLGRKVAISGTVHGDVIVVSGDIFVRPGGVITGRAIAIGGGVYPSALGRIEGMQESYRDNTFTITRTADAYELAYQSLIVGAEPPLLFPGVYGLRMPTYDRFNGLSLPFGPAFSFMSGRGQVDLLATYRSDLGKVDAAAIADLQLSRRTHAHLSAQRGSFSNDAWIWTDLVNSMSALILGTDTRNYYRADRVEATIARTWEGNTLQVLPLVGALFERAWSAGPVVGEQGGPWSLFGRKDSLGMWRPNPGVSAGTIVSALLGASAQWETEDVKLRATSRAEISAKTPDASQFQQLTTDLTVGFPTFTDQEYAVDVHWVTTLGHTPPPQRFAYSGGSGTNPFLDLLEQGGGELLLIDQRYSMELPNIRIGLLGNPTLLLRHRLTGAGNGGLPALDHILGAGVMLAYVRFEVQFDPSRKKVRPSIGFSFAR